MKFRVAWFSPHLKQKTLPKDSEQFRDLMKRLISLAVDTLEKGQKAVIIVERVE